MTEVPGAEKAAPQDQSGQVGPLTQSDIAPKGRLRAFAAWLTEWRHELLGGVIVLAALALALLDWQLVAEHGPGVLQGAVQDEAEAWIAAAGTVGLYATARHVSNLTEAIRELRVNQAAGAAPAEEASTDSGSSEADSAGTH